MVIGGFLKSSFIDYPDKIAAVIFTRGCNFRCPYCHNSELLDGQGGWMSREDLMEQIRGRIRYLDGLVVSGGEPTLHRDLPEFLAELRETGLSLKLDTNGTAPGMLKYLLEEGLVDYVAMDVKAPFSSYGRVAGSLVNIRDIEKSVKLLMDGPVPYEFRTTVARELLSPGDLEELAGDIRGADRYVLQRFRDSDGVLVGEGRFSAYGPAEMQEMAEKMSGHFRQVVVR